MRRPAPLRPAAVPPWPVPGWLTIPVLRVAIPDTPFGWGNAAATVPTEAQGIKEPASSEPQTVGFAEPGPAPPQDHGETATQVADAPPQEAAALIEPVITVSPEGEARLPVVDEPPVAPEGTAGASPEPRPQPAEISSQPQPAAAADQLAQSTPAAASTPDPGSAATSQEAGNLGHRPPAPPLNAVRPLGAPQAERRGAAADGAAGLPTTDVPALVEPQPESASEVAAPPQVQDRTADRTALRNRRLYRRVKLDAGFEIDGTAAQLLDISMGGFAAANAPALASEAVVGTTLRLTVDGVEISTRMRARMIYCEAPRSGGRFVDLTASQTALLRYLVTWRGQSVGAIGTTTLLDAITRWPEQGLPSAPALPPIERERRPGLFTRLLGWIRGRGDPNQ